MIGVERHRGLFDQFESPKIVFSPAGLESDDASKRADRKSIGFFVAGNCDSASIGMSVSAVASSRSGMNETI